MLQRYEENLRKKKELQKKWFFLLLSAKKSAEGAKEHRRGYTPRNKVAEPE